MRWHNLVRWSQAPKEESSGASPPRPKKEFLRKGSKLGAECLPKPKPFRRNGPRKAAVPKATEKALIVSGAACAISWGAMCDTWWLWVA